MIVVVGDPVLRLSDGGTPSAADGAAAGIARACVLAGATVQLAGKVGDDPAGNEILLSLGRDGIGHVALLRDAGLATRIAAAVHAADPELEAPSVDVAWADEEDEADEEDPSATTPPAADTAAIPRSGPSSLAPEDLAPEDLAPEDLDLALRYLVAFDVLVIAEPLAPETLAVAAEAAAFSGAHLVIAGGSVGVPALAGDAVTILDPPAADPDGDFVALVARYAVALDLGGPADAAFRSALGSSSWEPAAS